MNIIEKFIVVYKTRHWELLKLYYVFCFNLNKIIKQKSVSQYCNKIKSKIFYARFLKIRKKYLIDDKNNKPYFNINGAIFPDTISDYEDSISFGKFFEDTFLISTKFQDNYDKSIVEIVDKYMGEGPYGYVDSDGDFDVTVKPDDIVIDAGAWIGDFAAYAASKGAKVYAFEPFDEVFPKLQETSMLNSPNIIPVKKALGENDSQTNFSFSEHDSGGGSIVMERDSGKNILPIEVVSIDNFQKKQLHRSNRFY
jgi:FkbM family methyltransferase